MEYLEERFEFAVFQPQRVFVPVEIETQEALLGGVLAVALEKVFQQNGVILMVCIWWENIMYSHHSCKCCVLGVLS